MKGGNKWSTLVDYFLILSAIIGVGFASGKEICVFFFDFGAFSFVGLLFFGLLYVYLFFVIEYVKNKLDTNCYNDFNKALFGKFCKLSNIVMLINFSITSAGMLAGAEYIFYKFFNIKILPTILLSIISFVLLIGGIQKIKTVSNIIVPVMIATIVINSIANISFENVHFEIVKDNSYMAIFYAILFGVNNFLAVLPVIFDTRLKTKGKLTLIASVCMIILLNILVLATNHFDTDMPMFELSKNVSSSFYYIYFITLIMGIFSSLMICSYSSYKILAKGKKNIFVATIVVLLNIILSNFGYGFIVKYLYVLSGMFSGIYIVSLIITIIIKLIKIKSKKHHSKLNDSIVINKISTNVNLMTFSSKMK